MTHFIQVVTTVNSQEAARNISRTVVEKRLAACAQIIYPVESSYRWKGTVDTTTEWMVVAKSRKDLFSKLSDEISKLHPYDTPEIVATPIEAIGEKYGTWMDGELQ